MSLMVWIKVHIKEGKMDEYINLHNLPNGRAYTLSQEGCKSIIRSIDTENKNNLFTIYYILLSHKKHIKFYITNEK